MAKTNYAKVEEIIVKGLHKITIAKLLLLADVAESMGSSDRAKSAKIRVLNARIKQMRSHWISSIKRDLDKISKKDKEIYKQLNMKKIEINELLNNPEDLNEEDWEHIKKLYQSVKDYKQQFLVPDEESNEEHIEAERLKHINKRFNINEKWLPLK